MHSELLARLEAATGTDAHLGEAVLLACGWKKTSHGYFMGQLWGWSSPDGKTYCDHDHFRRIDPTASIDTALTLVPEGWRMAALCQRDPWFCRLETDDFESVTWGKGSDWITEVTSGSEATANAPTPALAIVIAALRAIEARQQ